MAHSDDVELGDRVTLGGLLLPVPDELAHHRTHLRAHQGIGSCVPRTLQIGKEGDGDPPRVGR